MFDSVMPSIHATHAVWEPSRCGVETLWELAGDARWQTPAVKIPAGVSADMQEKTGIHELNNSSESMNI